MKIHFKKIYKKFDRGVLDIGKQLVFVWKLAQICYVFEKIASQGDPMILSSLLPPLNVSKQQLSAGQKLKLFIFLSLTASIYQG